MKEIQDQGLLQTYLQKHQLEHIFIEPLKAHLSLYSFTQGETICFKGDPSESLYVLVKGKLKIYTTTAEGRTLIICFKTPLELIGDVEYIQGTELLNTVEAVSQVHMICIPYRWLKNTGGIIRPCCNFCWRSLLGNSTENPISSV